RPGRWLSRNLPFHGAAIAACREQGSLVHQVSQISAGEPGRATSQDSWINVRCEGHFAHVHFKDVLTAADIRQSYYNLAVETARTQKCRIKYVRTVGSSDDQHALAGLETIHFHKQLVQRRSEEHTSELQSR